MKCLGCEVRLFSTKKMKREGRGENKKEKKVPKRQRQLELRKSNFDSRTLLRISSTHVQLGGAGKHLRSGTSVSQLLTQAAVLQMIHEGFILVSNTSDFI